jgi:hypothetical protein
MYWVSLSLSLSPPTLWAALLHLMLSTLMFNLTSGPHVHGDGAITRDWNHDPK